MIDAVDTQSEIKPQANAVRPSEDRSPFIKTEDTKQKLIEAKRKGDPTGFIDRLASSKTETNHSELDSLARLYDISSEQAKGIVDIVTSLKQEMPFFTISDNQVDEYVNLAKNPMVKDTYIQLINCGFSEIHIGMYIHQDDQELTDQQYQENVMIGFSQLLVERDGYKNLDKVPQIVESIYTYLHTSDLQNNECAVYENLAEALGASVTDISTFYDKARIGPYDTYLTKQISDEVISDVEESGDEKKIYSFIYNFTDKDRYMFNDENYEQNMQFANRERDVAVQLFNKLSDPMMKELAALRIVEYNIHEDLGNLDLAKQFAERITDPELSSALRIQILKEEQRRVEGVPMYVSSIEKVEKQSKANVEKLLQEYGYDSPEKKAILDEEVKKVRATMGVSINISYENLIDLLSKGEKMKSMYDKGSSRVIRRKGARVISEKAMGMQTVGTLHDPHPIYGAMLSQNGSDEIYGAGGIKYGNSFVLLENDAIKERTIFGFGDSDHRFMTTWEDAMYVKALHNLEHLRNAGIEFVEARVLGGVKPEIFSSIHVPQTEVQINPQELEKQKQKYPSLQVEILDR